MTTLLLCFFVGGFVLGSAFGCGVTLWASMDRENKARKASPELMATMQEVYGD
jgi:cytochrome bd-type quinol oxidase subunit 2